MSIPCPECAGPRLDNYRFQHQQDCPLLPGEDARHAADYEHRWTFTRPATDTELHLARLFGDPVNSTTVVTPGPLRRRVIGGIDPDHLPEVTE